MKRILFGAAALAAIVPNAANASVAFSGVFTSATYDYFVGEAFGGVVNDHTLESFYVGDRHYGIDGPRLESSDYVGWGHRAGFPYTAALYVGSASGDDFSLIGKTGSFSFETHGGGYGTGEGLATFFALPPNGPATPIITAVPEAATWGMMILGFVGMGATMRYRRKSTNISFA